MRAYQHITKHPHHAQGDAITPETLDALLQGAWGTHLRTVSTALCTLGLHSLGEAASGRALSRHLRERLAARTHQAFDVAVLPGALAYARALAATYLPLVIPSQVGLLAYVRNWQLALAIDASDDVRMLPTGHTCAGGVAAASRVLCLPYRGVPAHP